MLHLQVRLCHPTIEQEELTHLAMLEGAGCEGISFLPYITGERTPNWPHASGGILGIRPGTLQRPGLLYRAALEGATFSLLAGTCG
jgi:xylulokinase